MQEIVNEGVRQLRQIGEEYTQAQERIRTEYREKSQENAAKQKAFLESLKGLTMEQKKAALQDYKNSK